MTEQGGTTFDKKTVYHSDLRKAGTLVVKFTKYPDKSKFKNRPDWVPFNVENDPGAYTYQIENEKIHAVLDQVPLNTWMKVTFLSGEESGEMVVQTVEGGPVEMVTEKPKAASNGKSRARPTPRARRIDGYPTYYEDLWYAIVASKGVHDRYAKEFGEPLPESVRSLGVAIHIQASRESYAKPLADGLATPDEIAAGPVPSESEIAELAENAPITAQQRESLIESLADGTMDDERRRTMVAWLKQKIADADEDAPADLFAP